MKQKRFLSMLVLLAAVVTGAMAQTTYTVVGDNEAMFGSVWDISSTANDMTKNGDGTYSITYTNVYLTEKVQYRVVEDRDWNKTYPDEYGVINIAKAGTYTVTIHFDPTTHKVYETMPGYNVTLAEGTEDATSWTIEPNSDLEGGETVTATYSGDRKVKSVKAVKKAAVSFTEVTTFNELQTALSAGKNVKLINDIECTEGIEITSNGVTIDGNGKKLTLNKGISLASGATLTIQGNGTMVVNGTNENTTSTVAGSTGTLILTSGTLTATGGKGEDVDEDWMNADVRAYAGGNAINGNVTVSGGTLTAIGGNGGSIGDFSSGSHGADGGVAISGSVTVTDGTVTATGGNGGSIGADASGANGGSGGAAIGGNATISGGTWTASNGTNGGGGGGAGGKAVAGTVTDNR